MPGFDAVVQVIDNLNEKDLRGNIRETLTDWMGTFASDTAMDGVLNATTGIDFGSRFGTGSFGPFNGYNGFSAENMFGAFGGLVQSMHMGTKQLLQGEPIWDNQAIPNALKPIVRAYGNDGMITNSKGEPVYKPEGAEAVAVLMGWKPYKLKKTLQLRKSLLMRQESEKSMERAYYGKLAEMLDSGGSELVKQAIETRVLQDSSFDADLAYRRVADAYLNKKGGKDPLAGISTTNAEAKLKLIAAHGIDLPDYVSRKNSADEIVKTLKSGSSRRKAKEPNLRQRVSQPNWQKSYY
jgi:hypothetical protein